MQKERLYIAYGSNMNLRQMQYRCPTAKPIGVTKIKDYELIFRGSKTGSYATIEPKDGGSVPAMLWTVELKDELALDRYEGYPTFYKKESVDLKINDEPVTAFIYVMTEGHHLGIPSDVYIKTIKEGYIAAGFDPEILERAIDNTKERMVLDEVNDFEPENINELRWW